MANSALFLTLKAVIGPLAVDLARSKVVVAIVKVAIAVAVSRAMTDIPKAPKTKKPSFSRDVTLRSSVAPRNIVYGTALVSRVLVYGNAAGTNNRDLWMIIAMAGHEISDITDVWLDGDKIAEADINSTWTAGEGAANTVDGGTFFVSGTDAVTFWKHFGSSSQTHNADVLTAFGSDWSTSHDGQGVAYLVTRLRLVDATKTMFESGAPQNIKALVKGKKDVYDPRLDSGGAGDDPTNASFQAHTSNPILCIANYLTDSLGMGIGTARIDWTTVSNEAAYCDTLVPNSSAGGMEARFTCNGSINTDELHKANLKALLSSCNGRLTVNAGQWVVTAGRLGSGATLVTNGAFTTDSDWTKNAWTINTTSGRAVAAGAITSDIEQSISITNGKQYVVHFVIVTISAGSVTPRLGGTAGTARSAVGSYTEIITAGAGGSPELEMVGAGVTATIDSVEVHAIGEIAVDDSWLAGDIVVNSGLTKESRFNTLHAFYFSEDDNYKLTQSRQVQVAAALTRDGSEELIAERTLPFTATDDEAQRIGLKNVLATDNELSVVVPCNYKGLQVTIHDVLSLTISAFSWTAKLFRVTGWEFTDIGASQQGIQLTLIEESVAAYKDASTADLTTVTAPSAVSFASFSGSDPTVKTITVSNPPAQQFTTDGTTYAPTNDRIIMPVAFVSPSSEAGRATIAFDLNTGAEQISWSDGDLVTNGAFAADTNWTKGANWTIGSGVATAATASSDLEQSINISPGLTYEVIYTITAYTSGTLTVKIGGTAGTTRSSAATFTETITAGSGAAPELEFTGSSFVGSIDDVSVNGSHGDATTTALAPGFSNATNSVAVDVTHTASGLVGRAHAWLSSTESGGGGGK